MPVFYFSLRYAGKLIEDKEGSVLPDLASACAEARASARDLAVQLIRAEQAVDGQRIEISDAAGRVLACVLLKEAAIKP